MTKQEGFTRIGPTVGTVTQRSLQEVGSSAGRTGAVLSPSDTDRVAAWLARQRPADMDKAALSRASQHGVGLQVKYEGRYPTGPNGERLGFYMVATACEVSPSGDREAALADLRNFMTPAPLREIEAWLAVLSVTVAKRRDDEFTEELRLTTYAGRLARYPADIVKHVTSETYTFWPTWEEMEKRCEALTSPRRQMIAALERGPDAPEPEYRPPTAEEKARIQALIDEMFPSASANEKQDAMDLAMARVKVMDTPA